MHFLPKTKTDRAKFLLFPFKAYVAVAQPLAWLIPNIERRHGYNLSFDIIFPGYIVCLLVLLTGGIVQWASGQKHGAIITLIFAAISLWVLFYPRFYL